MYFLWKFYPPCYAHYVQSHYTRAIFCQGPIGRDIKTTVRIRWSFAQMSLLCPSITTHRTCQFWVRSEPVNMPKTIRVSCQMWSACYNLILYSEKAMRNVVLMYCPSSWQCSAAHCSCNKEAPEAFSIASVWSPTIIRPDLSPCDFHLFRRIERSSKFNILVKWQTRGRIGWKRIGWLLWRGYWKVGTKLRKMFMSEHRLGREVAGRCG